MVRVKSSVASRKRRKKILKRAKGFVGDRKNHLRLSKDTIMKALAYNYEHRKKKKSDFRRLWIIRIGVGAKLNGISYSKFINGLSKMGCKLNRKMLSDMALTDPQSFEQIVNTAKQSF